MTIFTQASLTCLNPCTHSQPSPPCVCRALLGRSVLERPVLGRLVDCALATELARAAPTKNRTPKAHFSGVLLCARCIFIRALSGQTADRLTHLKHLRSSRCSTISSTQLNALHAQCNGLCVGEKRHMPTRTCASNHVQFTHSQQKERRCRFPLGQACRCALPHRG